MDFRHPFVSLNRTETLAVAAESSLTRLFDATSTHDSLRHSFPDVDLSNDLVVTDILARALHAAQQAVKKSVDDWVGSNNLAPTFQSLDLSYAHSASTGASHVPDCNLPDNLPDVSLPQRTLQQVDHGCQTNQAHRLTQLLKQRHDEVEQVRRLVTTQINQTRRVCDNLQALPSTSSIDQLHTPDS